MERIKTISMLCVLLACVAPAMADYVVVDGGGVYSQANVGLLKEISYVGDSAAYQAWLTSNYSPDYTGTADYSPSYSNFNASPATQLPGASDTVRFQHATEMTAMRIDATSPATIQWNKVYMGDNYYPRSYAYTSNYAQGGVRQEGASSVSIGTLNFGRDAAELPNTLSMAAFATWNIRAGSLNINDVVVTNDNFDAIYDTYSGSVYLGQTTVKIGADGAGTDNSEVINISNISLNETRLWMFANSGTWNITGDISYGGDVAGSKGNLVLLLTAPQNIGGPALGATVTMQESELMQLIDDGQFFVKTHIKTGPSLILNTQALNASLSVSALESNMVTAITGGDMVGKMIVRPVTRDSMYDELQIVDMGGGMVKVNIIPEPATLVLLGLGAVLSFRRKR